MVGMTREELEKLYDAVETAVQKKKALVFPEKSISNSAGWCSSDRSDFYYSRAFMDGR